MDYDRFDELTRTVVAEPGTRRAVFRFLAGGALGSVATRFGLTELAAAKEKRKRPKSQRGEKGPGQLQAQRKRNNRRHKKRKPQLPQSCSIDCEELEGGTCCPDGSCAAAGSCCPGQFLCRDGQCASQDECCSDERRCPGGSCITADQCCSGEKKCLGYSECFAADDCCPNALPPLCGECDKVVCVNGGLVCRPRTNCCPQARQCPDGSCRPEDGCCPGEKRCGDSCLPANQCCQAAPPPPCADNEESVCCEGEQVCRYYRDRPEICDGIPARSYNPVLCRCECPPGTIDGPFSCCPADYPLNNDTSTCCRWEVIGGVWVTRCVCALGFAPDAHGVCRR